VTRKVDDADEALKSWQRLRRVFGTGSRTTRKRIEAVGDDLPYGRGRDPRSALAVLNSAVETFGWATPLEQTDLVTAWRDIAGEETAQHAAVEGIVDGVLTVKCDSTAWATQLRLMRSQIEARIADKYPRAGVESIRFVGPNTTSWNRGPRSVPGRGPRDTYG
jgi:predicted nucleic acid-binding Zn ribbon protein